MKRYTARPMATDDPRHGTDNGYTNCRCRCGPCTMAHSAKWVEYETARGRTPLPATIVGADNNATRRAVTTTDSAMTREEYYRRTADPPRVVVSRHNSIGQLLAGDFR